jgi:hypothetical protein
MATFSHKGRRERSSLNIRFNQNSSRLSDAANWTCVEGLANDTTEDADAVLRDRGSRDTDDHD